MPNIYDYVKEAILSDEEEYTCSDEDYADAVICELESMIESKIEQLKENEKTEQYLKEHEKTLA